MSFNKCNIGNVNVTNNNNNNNCQGGHHNQQGQKHECKYADCDAIFQTKKGLDDHVKEAHTKKKRDRKQDSKAATKKSYKPPAKEERFKCTHCEQDFKNPKSMQSHRSRSHKGEDGTGIVGRLDRAAKASRQSKLLAKLKTNKLE